MRPTTTFVFALGLAVFAGAQGPLAEQPNPALQGLQKVEGSVVTLAYQRPGTRWDRYKSLQLLPLDVQVVADRPGSQQVDFRAAFDRQAALQQMFSEEMRSELAKQNFLVVETPRADTLIVQARVYQLVSGSLSIRMAFSDGATRTVVGAINDFQSQKGLVSNREDAVREVRGAFRIWGRLIAQHLHALAAAADVDPLECFQFGKKCN